jgi:hypothetical protein
MNVLPRKWILGGLLAIAAVIGLFIARGAAAGNAGYFGGLAIFLFAVLAIFALIGGAYGPWPMPSRNPLPANAALRWVMGGAVALLAIVGLFDASGAAGTGFAYFGGLAIFVLAIAFDFLLIKDWFDRRDRNPRLTQT